MYVYYLYINMCMISMKKSPITLKFKKRNIVPKKIQILKPQFLIIWCSLNNIGQHKVDVSA